LKLCEQAANGRSAFEEGVRWVAPIQASSRLVMEDTEIRGCFIPKGDTVMTIQASANRDEEVFEDGENYNGLREPNPHQAFGNGPHHCAGANLSRRTVGAVLLPMLFERFPHMTLPDPASVRWHGFGLHKGDPPGRRPWAGHVGKRRSTLPLKGRPARDSDDGAALQSRAAGAAFVCEMV
jgi:cytochrome P450